MADLTDLHETERTRAPGPDTERLEELWALPWPSQPAHPGRVRRLLSEVDARLGGIVALGWIVFVGSVFFEPAPPEGTATPIWAEVLIAGFLLALCTAGILAVTRGGRLAFGAAFGAGILGLSLAIGCMATDHHPGAWWGWELAATGVLTALAAAGLRRSRSR
jgi:hypothetical protein